MMYYNETLLQLHVFMVKSKHFYFYMNYEIIKHLNNKIYLFIDPNVYGPKTLFKFTKVETYYSALKKNII